MSENLDLFLVEDDEDIGYLMRKSLERSGYRVTVCRMGADALMVLANTPFHLVILDNKLPDMSGVTLLESLNEQGITTPVLMVTGFGDEQLVAQVLKAGALDYVAKDTALAFLTELPKRVHEAVTRHRLQQSNRLLIEALESAADGVMITDVEGTIRHVNQSLEKISGYDRDELLGQNPRLMNSGKHRKTDFDELWKTILSGRMWQGELVNRGKDGALFDVSLTVSPIFNNRGQITNFVGIYRDIAERKLMERQLFQAQKMQSVGTLAGGVAHEFNNLLAGIQGYATLGEREQGINESSREFFHYISDLSQRAAGLTRQLLAFARKPTLSREPTLIDSLLRQTADFVRRSMSIDVQLILPPPDEGPLNALVDNNQLQQVLVNLTINARDALDPHDPQPIIYRVSRVRSADDINGFPEVVRAGDYILVEVEDRGKGMSSEVLSQALDPFFTTKDVGQGTGLGLPVAFGIVHGHQGFLNIATEEGVGTRVSMYLPRLTDAVSTKTATAAKQFTTPKPSDVPSRHILVIDDENSVLDIIKRFLEIAGHRATCVTNAGSACDILREDESIDLVILDLMIPNEHGNQSFREIRQLRPSIPVLLCTGLLQTQNGSDLIDQEAVSLIRKPFQLNEMWNAVHLALGLPVYND